MRAKLKRLHSPDVDDLEAWSPAVPDSFGILVQAMIGPLNSEGAESFDIVVCSPQWFAEQMNTAVQSAEHTLFMSKYDYRALLHYLEGRVHAVEAPNWAEIGSKLGRLGRWEFEDYRP